MKRTLNTPLKNTVLLCSFEKIPIIFRYIDVSQIIPKRSRSPSHDSQFFHTSFVSLISRFKTESHINVLFLEIKMTPPFCEKNTGGVTLAVNPDSRISPPEPCLHIHGGVPHRCIIPASMDGHRRAIVIQVIQESHSSHPENLHNQTKRSSTKTTAANNQMSSLKSPIDENPRNPNHRIASASDMPAGDTSTYNRHSEALTVRHRLSPPRKSEPISTKKPEKVLRASDCRNSYHPSDTNLHTHRRYACYAFSDPA